MISRLRDVGAIAAVFAAVVVCWNPRTPWLRDGMLYVAPTGSDWHSGATRETPLATIQHALDRVCPGETIVLLPGVYRERLHAWRDGTAAAPIVLRAEQPGSATISGALPQEMIDGWNWRDEEDGVFSAPVCWPVHFVVCDGKSFFEVRWGGVEALRNLVTRPGAHGAFCYEQGRLYVYIEGAVQPEGRDWRVHGKIPPPREWGVLRATNIRCEADHVTFEGLRFELGVGSGALVRRGEGVTFHDCVFSGARVGVDASWAIDPPDGLRVEHCLYHNYPQGDWIGDWLSWNEIYAAYDTSSLVRSIHGGATICHNLVVHGADLIRVTSDAHHAEAAVEVCDNLLAWCTDDAIELDGESRHVRVHGNLIYDAFVGVSLSPVLAGPVTVEHNRFVSPPDGRNGAAFKLLDPWGDRGPTRGVRIHDNTVVGNALTWWRDPVTDVVVRDNQFLTKQRKDPPWPRGATDSDNRYVLFAENDRADGHDQRAWREAHDSALRDPMSARPGPHWLDWTFMAATRQLVEVFDHTERP